MLRDKIAELCHFQWSGWMKYLFSKCKTNSDGTVIIPKEMVERWNRQHSTTFDMLSKSEQDSDRVEAEKFQLLFANYSLDHKLRDGVEMKTIPPLIDPQGKVIHPNLDNDGYPRK